MKDTHRDFALELDRLDELAHFRDRFTISDPELIYLDGNSLGRMPLSTEARVLSVLKDGWGKRLILGWNEGWWIDMQARIGDKIGRLIGAEPGEVVVADSTSINLYKLAVAALRGRPGRKKILTDSLNFPSDLYILEGLCQVFGSKYSLEIIPSEDGIHGPVEALIAAMDADTALVSLSHTTYQSAYTYEMSAINQAAHRVGALTLWDLSHSVGSYPVLLQSTGADLAVGCTYKYLNGGPGSPAFLYVRGELQESLGNPISGWVGQQDPFEFDQSYTPGPGITRFLTGTPPILSIAAIEDGVDLILAAGIDQLRAKSLRQTEYLIDLWRSILEPLCYGLESPDEPGLRGSHISLSHPEGWRINQALIQEMKVLPDFRKPNLIRLGIAPLYTQFVDIYTAVERMAAVIREKRHIRYSETLGRVT